MNPDPELVAMDEIAWTPDEILDYQRRKQEADGETRLQELGVVNRESARRAGFRNPKQPRLMKVPK